MNKVIIYYYQEMISYRPVQKSDLIVFSSPIKIGEYNTVVWSQYLNYYRCLDDIQNHFLALECDLTREQHSPYQPLLHFC